MRKRVVLVFPKIIKGWQAQPRMSLPLSLLSIATPALEAGFDVKIIDQRVEPRWEKILRSELEQKPLCVGITTMTGQQLRKALEISRLVKEHSDTPVIWGGPHASLLPEQTLRNECIDIIARGEAEATFPELLAALETHKPLSSVKGIWYRENGIIHSTSERQDVDLNTLSPPAYHLIDINKYFRLLWGVEYLDFYTSRGCPHQCAFCYNTAFNRMRWRMMEPELVIQRIKDLVSRYQVKGIVFNDSNFFLDMTRARAIIAGLLEADLRINLSHINIDFFTLSRMEEQDFALLAKARCKDLPIAVESGSRRIQELIKKPVDPQALRAVNRRLKQYDIAVKYGFMMGIPTETKADLSESLELAFHLIDENPNADASFNIYTPFPGTGLFDLAVKHGLRFPQNTEEWATFNYRKLAQGGPWLTPEMRHLVEVFDFCTFFITDRRLVKPYEKRNHFISLISRLYTPVARMRLKHLWDAFPIEVMLAKALGLYARQD